MSLYSKDNPFPASLKDRKVLTAPDSAKRTHHVELDLTGSGLTYEAGDCVAIFATNTPDVVDRTLAALDGDETLRLFLTHEANVSHISKGLLHLLATRIPALQPLLERTNRDQLKAFLEEHEVWDLLETYGNPFTPNEICEKLTKLMPRYYSIASAMPEVGEEVHLTVRHIEYTSRQIRRLGVCTHLLCERAPLGSTLPLFIHPTDHFRLPQDDHTPIIMIGPGTGIAPYRAFLQERLARNAPGKNWLFFGEWTARGHFFYEPFWRDLEARGKLRLTTAFSRDQAHKVYVQDRLREHATDLYHWLEKGAHLYLCGDAHQMAPAVEQTLLDILAPHTADPKAYLKSLRHNNRYLRDVY
jgi:sulfite reductase (NADPH) flavoprotein alpha-component